MKKAVCIVGSPNPTGSTTRLVAEVSKGLSDAGMEPCIFHLSKMKIGYCTGCNGCMQTRRCVQRDDMDLLTGQLLQADVVCIGSPSWWGDVTAQLKAFIDRSLPLCDTRAGGPLMPPGKLGMSIAVRAGRSAAENVHLLETIEHYYGHLGIKAASRLHFEGINTPADLAPEALACAYEAGLRIDRVWERREIPFTLRNATMADLPQLAEMNLALIRDEGSDNPMGLAELEQRMRGFLAGSYHGLMILAGGNPAGYCLYRPETERDGIKPGIYLRQYYVKPEYRQNGLGRAALEQIMREHFSNAAFVELDVLDCNAVGRAFWSRTGFKPVYHRMKRNL